MFVQPRPDLTVVRLCHIFLEEKVEILVPNDLKNQRQIGYTETTLSCIDKQEAVDFLYGVGLLEMQS